MWYNLLMNDRQKLFCKMYVKHKFNGSRAAIDAGYSEKTARSQANGLITKPDIRAEIQAQINRILSETDRLTLKWLQEVEALAFSNETAIDSDKNIGLLRVKKTTDKNGDVTEERTYDPMVKVKNLDLLGKFIEIGTRPQATDADEAKQLDHDERKDRLAYLLEKRVK